MKVQERKREKGCEEEKKEMNKQKKVDNKGRRSIQEQL